LKNTIKYTKAAENKIIEPCSGLSTVSGQPQHHAHTKKPQEIHVTLTFGRWT